MTADPTELIGLDVEVRGCWPTVRKRLIALVGVTQFGVWLSAIEPIGVSAVDGALVLATSSPEAHVWSRGRYGHLIHQLSPIAGRPVRLASDRELALHGARRRSDPSSASDPVSHQEAL